jgi:hypothetical protein
VKDREIIKIMGCAMRRDDFTLRGTLIHAARVYLAQSRHFTSLHRGFSFVLLDWAARLRAEAMSRPADVPAAAPRVTICGRAPRRTDHRQMDLFGSEA